MLVVGGSQGARLFSEIVPAAIARLSKPERAPRARPAVPPRGPGAGGERLRRAQPAELAPFFDDLPERMTASHLIVSRAGASSVAELLALGRPALLVPYRAAEETTRARMPRRSAAPAPAG